MTEYPAFCLSVLRAALLHGDADKAPPPTFADERCPLFVTFHKSTRRGEELRGCIGTFTSVELADGLKKYTLQSAFNDRRFDPIDESELDSLVCSVSLLRSFEDAEHVYDWEVGTHGIWIDFPLNGRRTTATYLPEVCEEQGWTKEECLESLYRKGGHRGRVTRELIEATQLTRYQSHKFRLSHAEYVKLAVSTTSPAVPADNGQV